MKLFEIKHRFTGKLIFKLETTSMKLCVEAAVSNGADLSGADFSGSDFSGSDFSGVNFSGADFSRADFSGADFSGADFSGADFSGADLSGAYFSGANFSGVNFSWADGEKIKIENTPLQILGLYWDIIIFDKHMKIGCEFHAIQTWGEFKDDRISQMDHRAREWWKKNKETIMSFCRANGRGE